MAVIHTDIYQFVILFVGFVITLVLCIPGTIHIWDEARAAIPAEFFQPEGGRGWIFLITTFFAFLFGEAFAPGYATRYCVGRNVRHTKIGIAGVGAFLALTFPAILFFIALYARLHFPEIEPQQALPMVVTELNNPVVGALIIAALLSAVMSSADSALNSSTAIFVKDLFEHQLGWKDTMDGRTLRMARICSAVLGCFAVVVAVVWTDIIDLLLFTYHVWAPAVILPVCVGAFWKERSPQLTTNIVATMLVATAATFVYRLTPYRTEFDPAVFGVMVSCVIFFALRATVLRPAKNSHPT
jgi:SSS family solute:Na+ symporter